MIYCGLDMSLTGTGVCLLNTQDNTHMLGTIKTKPKDFENNYTRIDYIIKKTVDLIGENIDSVAIETPFFGRTTSPKMAMSLGALAHMMRRELYQMNIKFYDVAPMALKKFVLGVGKGDKNMIMMQVYKKHGLEPEDDNQADAIVLAKIAQAIDAYKKSEKLLKYESEVVEKILNNG